MYNNMKIKLHTTTRASEQLVRDPIGGVSLNIIPYVKIVIHVNDCLLKMKMAGRRQIL